jgi:acyl-CoA thioesterase I
MIETGADCADERIGRSRTLIGVASLIAASIATAEVEAQEFRIVAVGASNTFGRGVGASHAWPARLEALLRARGYDVQIINAGINGDDTNGMRARVTEVVPNGTRLVILDTTDTNDRRRRVDTKANAAAIVDELKARGIRTIVVPSLHAMSEMQLQGDGIHITANGHGVIATKLSTKVIEIVGSARRR